MSLYNMMNGVTQATFLILPMLGKHPDDYPRFRDCFTSDEDHPEYNGHIHIYTRTGGGNRESYESENAAMCAMDGYVTDFDDGFDPTFASWVFRVPDEFVDDFKIVNEGRLTDTSDRYREALYKVYPKLKEKLDSVFFPTAADAGGEG